MDNQTQSTKQSNKLLIASTQLWVGQHDAVVAHITQLLANLLCPNGGCNTCTVCMQIREHQHHAIMWLYPEKTYTKDQFNDLFATMAFALEQDNHYFFIIQKADFLPPASANQLLKSLEEPPPGYHFILIAERADQILPTIKSRCIMHEFGSTHEVENHPLFAYFSNSQLADPVQFLKVLDQSKINERESIELLDALLRYWTKQYKKTLNNGEPAKKALTVLKRAFKKPPMPGSSKIFWKDLYLQMHE